MCCYTKVATGAINPESLAISSINFCIKVSDRGQPLTLWLSLSIRTPRWIIAVTTLSKNEKEKYPTPSVDGQYSVVETSKRISSAIFLDTSHLVSLGGLNSQFYFYLDPRPQLLPTYPVDGKVCPRRRGMGAIYAVTSVLSSCDMSSKVFYMPLGCSACSRVCIMVVCSHATVRYRLERRAVSNKCSFGFAASRN